MARTLLRRYHRTRALAWARAHAASEREARRLARSLSAHHGRFVARSAFLGMREPEAVRDSMEVRGAEHLAAAPRAILLGFHLGPAQSYVALRAEGHRLVWVGGRGASPAWAPAIRARYLDGRGDLLFPNVPYAWERRLYAARNVLDGGRVFISADGVGAEAFAIALPGGSASIGAGWLALRRMTRAPVLPVLSHLEGRRQIVTVHPPLPPADPDADIDRAICRAALAPLLDAHVRRVPEQCYSLAFGLPADEPRAGRTGASLDSGIRSRYSE